MGAVLSQMIVDVSYPYSRTEDMNGHCTDLTQRADTPSQCLGVAIVAQP